MGVEGDMIKSYILATVSLKICRHPGEVEYGSWVLEYDLSVQPELHVLFYLFC